MEKLKALQKNYKEIFTQFQGNFEKLKKKKNLNELKDFWPFFWLVFGIRKAEI